MPDSNARLKRIGAGRETSERTTGFEPATPTLAVAWRMSHASPPVSPVPLSCAFLALLSHPSHQIAGVDSISLVISLVLSRHGRPIPPKEGDHPTQQCRGQGVPAEGSHDPSPFGAPHRLDSMNGADAHDKEGDSDAGEKEQGQERHAQEDRRPEDDGCSAKACSPQEAGGQENHDPEKDGGPQEAGGQEEGHDPEKDGGPQEAGGQEGHDPEKDGGPQEAGGQDV